MLVASVEASSGGSARRVTRVARMRAVGLDLARHGSWAQDTRGGTPIAWREMLKTNEQCIRDVYTVLLFVNGKGIHFSCIERFDSPASSGVSRLMSVSTSEDHGLVALTYLWRLGRLSVPPAGLS